MKDNVVWPFIPEYEMTEELEWLTDVITCPEGEDRICLRGDPRQSLNYLSYMEDLIMAEAKSTSRLILEEFYIPYWLVALVVPHVSAPEGAYEMPNLTEEHKGVGVFMINTDRDYRSFSEREAGVLLDGENLGWGDSYGNFYGNLDGPCLWAFKYNPLDPFVIEGSTLVPQTLAVLEQPVDFDHQGGTVWRVDIRATNTAPPIRVFEYQANQYKGIDIFDLTNMGSGLSEQHFTEFDNVESESGIIQGVRVLKGAETLTSIGFDATTKQEIDAVKSWIYSRQGKLVPFWVRSNNQDFMLKGNFTVDPNDPNRTIVVVRKVKNLVAPFKVSVKHVDGTEEFLTCIFAEENFNDTHTLVFKENTTRTWVSNQVKDMRILVYARQDSDRVELKYEAGGNLLADVPVRELYYDFENEQ